MCGGRANGGQSRLRWDRRQQPRRASSKNDFALRNGHISNPILKKVDGAVGSLEQLPAIVDAVGDSTFTVRVQLKEMLTADGRNRANDNIRLWNPRRCRRFQGTRDFATLTGRCGADLISAGRPWPWAPRQSCLVVFGSGEWLMLVTKVDLMCDSVLIYSFLTGIHRLHACHKVVARRP
jgi:hypothetical protein